MSPPHIGLHVGQTTDVVDTQGMSCCADQVRVALVDLLLQHNILTSKLNRLWLRPEQVKHDTHPDFAAVCIKAT